MHDYYIRCACPLLTLSNIRPGAWPLGFDESPETLISEVCLCQDPLRIRLCGCENCHRVSKNITVVSDAACIQLLAVKTHRFDLSFEVWPRQCSPKHESQCSWHQIFHGRTLAAMREIIEQVERTPLGEYFFLHAAVPGRISSTIPQYPSSSRVKAVYHSWKMVGMFSRQTQILECQWPPTPF